MNTTASAEKPTVLLTFDVEDWFQVENFKAYIPYSSWDGCELRVWKNTRILLDLLDQAPGAPKATFFMLGWVAGKLPGLVRAIEARGHEIASHGFGHGLCGNLNPQAFEADLAAGRQVLEEITGKRVQGYRAPSFSITDQALDIVKRAGFRYDSSFNSFGGNRRYGRLNLNPDKTVNGVHWLDHGFAEIPVSNFRWGQKILPLGGGGYFRLFPFVLFKKGMDQVIQREKAFVFYAHPWEFDPDQPRVHQASAGFRFRHYIHLARTERKLLALINAFSHCRFTTISRHLDTQSHYSHAR